MMGCSTLRTDGTVVLSACHCYSTASEMKNPPWRVCTCIKSSNLSPPLLHQYRASLLLRALSFPKFHPTVFLRIIEMISKSFSKFIALMLITSSLTYSVNATPMIAPSRQSLFLNLVDQVLMSRLTSDSGAESPLTGEKRRDVDPTLLTDINNLVITNCQPDADQTTCLLDIPRMGIQSAVYYCHESFPSISLDDQASCNTCLNNYCPVPNYSTVALLGCIVTNLAGYNPSG